MYPTKTKINDEIYNLNTDFRIALRCYRIVDDSTISDSERALAIIYLIFGFIPKENQEEYLSKAKKFLEGPYEFKNNDKERDLDFEQDKKYILASFYSEYKIDLEIIEYMHFWKFLDFIAGLSENTILYRVRALRNIDLNDIKDDKKRAEIAQAQYNFAIKEEKTLEEIEADKLWEEQTKGSD